LPGPDNDRKKRLECQGGFCGSIPNRNNGSLVLLKLPQDIRRLQEGRPDAAMETADIALMADDLTKLPWLIRHGRRSLGIIRQNIVFALGVKLLFMGLALANLATLWMAIAADMGASLLVIMNALRLLDGKRAHLRP